VILTHRYKISVDANYVADLYWLSEVRLVGGSNPNEGRVEVRYNDTWGTVCSQLVNDAIAKVVCRQLGLPYGDVVLTREFGEGSGQIWLDGVICAGDESSVGDCQHKPWGVHHCHRTEDFGVKCQDGKDWMIH
jgi:hypothetical protein